MSIKKKVLKSIKKKNQTSNFQTTNPWNERHWSYHKKLGYIGNEIYLIKNVITLGGLFLYSYGPEPVLSKNNDIFAIDFSGNRLISVNIRAVM